MLGKGNFYEDGLIGLNGAISEHDYEIAQLRAKNDALHERVDYSRRQTKRTYVKQNSLSERSGREFSASFLT